MCGIVGYLGHKNTKEILLNGLKELEYRGYDSAGITILNEKKEFKIFKSVGKLINLEDKMSSFEIPKNNFTLGIGHTRWATHGKPTEENAHPHKGEYTHVVHNGIIENYVELKDILVEKGYSFVSQTDTEVIAHLFEENLKNLKDEFDAFQETVRNLNGAYAILLVTKNADNKIFFARKGSPLILGTDFTTGEHYFASSDSPLIDYVSSVIYLEDGDSGFVSENEIQLLDSNNNILKPDYKTLPSNKLTAQKDGFRFFMEKEIYEQESVVADTLMGRVSDHVVKFDELDDNFFDGINEIKLCACGTSYHSSLAGAYLFEKITKIKTTVEIGSEFRYKEPFLTDDTLFVAISQSGETADTLESLKMAKENGLKTLSICNVDNSSMVRLADQSLLTRAGVEKGVASTKAFATQVTVLWLLSVYLAKLRNSQPDEVVFNELKNIQKIPESLKVSSKLHERIKRLSKRYLHGHGFFFIGRDIFYPLALEGALKLKEISYLHAEGYPAGEMKHGPIALADPELFTIALLPKNRLYDKTKSNIEELSARDSTICVISPLEFELADDFIKTGNYEHYMLEFFEMMLSIQLLSMEVALRIGNDVDMPRNLAKSVTVE